MSLVGSAQGKKPTFVDLSVATQNNFVWQSRNSNLNDLSTEFGELYGTLSDAAIQGIGVETYIYRGDTARSLEEIMRQESLVAGKSFPTEADIYVCKINPAVCKIVAKKSVSVASWRNKPTDKVRLPKLLFEPVIVHREYLKKADQRLDTIVVEERGGCKQYDSTCRKYVSNLNRVPMDELENRYEGPVLVPTLSYRTRIDFKNISESSKSLRRKNVAKAVQKLLLQRPNTARSIVPEVKFEIQATPKDSSSEGTRKKIFELISHPFAYMKKIPNGNVSIGVFDTWLDSTHCDIASSVKKYIDAGERPAGMESVKPCGTRGISSEPFDHGTHVVGLLSGRVNGKSGTGVNPNASIYFVQINPQAMKSDDSVYLNHVSERLNTIYKNDRVDVVNLSFQYPFPLGLNDTFLTAIKNQYRVTLFVAAAGNYNQELSAGSVCPVRPACAGIANIITVASVDLSPDNPMLDSSNYGSAVHIAAPGKNILSSISGGRLGPMSGTSQAAPLVAGAASLLLMQNPKLYPEQVKNRLIYTSDLFPSLYKKVLGGRLNITRALAFESAQLSLVEGKGMRGQVVNMESSIALFNIESGEKLNPLWSQIRRLKYDKKAGSYVMFWKQGNVEPLKRSFVAPQNRTQILQFRSDETVPSLQTYVLGKIDDYVAAIPDDS